MAKFLKRRKPHEKGKAFGVPGDRFDSAKQDGEVDIEAPRKPRGVTVRRKPKLTL